MWEVVRLDESTKLLLKYCKDSKAKRGLEYLSQIDYVSLDVGEVNVLSIRQILYVHTQFKTIHNREIVQMNVKRRTRIGTSHYY